MLLTELFISSKEFSKYCQCSPKCTRNVYDVSMSQSEFSKSAFQDMILHFPDSQRLREIERIQDWTLLNKRNRNYTKSLYKIDDMEEMNYVTLRI